MRAADHWTHRWNPAWIAWAAAMGWLAYLVGLPIGYMVVDGITDDDGLTLANIATFAADPRLRLATLNSLLVAAGVALLSVLVGTPLAFGVARTAMRGKGLVQATIIISLVSPDFLLAMAYIALAGPNAGYVNVVVRAALGLGDGPGPLNIFSLWGLIFTALPHGVSYVFLALVPALHNLDPALDEAARVQGARAWSTVRDITLPLLRPALLSGALLAFAGCLAMYGPPQMLRLNVLTISIREALLALDFKAASVASLTLIAVSLAALALYRHSTRQAERFRTMGGKSFAHRPVDIGLATYAIAALGVVYCFMALIVPYGTLFAVSFMKSVGDGFTAGNWTLANYYVVFTNPVARAAAQLSLRLAASSATLVVAMGFLVAYLLVRSRVRTRALLDYLSILPLAVPGTALAIALIVVYLNPPLNVLGLYGSVGILLVAYLTRFVPFGTRASQSALMQLAPELEEASRISGAGALKTVLVITAPLVRHALVYGWILVFILALPELSASVILKGLDTQTLSTVLLDVWNGNGGLAAASAFGIAIFVCVGTLLLVARRIGKRAGFTFAA